MILKQKLGKGFTKSTLSNWASEVSPTLGCSIEISCDTICTSNRKTIY